VKVMDFGIARAMADAAGTMTQTQAVIGTAQYLSPEQARGEAVDSRSDLYSTGCLLFELLTGRPPFVGDSPVAVAYQHAREVPQPPSAFASDVPEALDRITMKALAKDRNDRYSSAAEFRADLEAALRGGHVGAPALGAAGAAALGAGAAAATQVMQPTPAAATQVMQPTPAAPPAAVPGWAPLGTTTAPPAGHGRAAVEPEDEEPRRPWVIWALVAVAVIAIIGIVWLLTRGDATEPDAAMVPVPDVVGFTAAAAEEAIVAAELEFKPVQEPSADVDEGLVISTDPEADRMVEKGTTVEVVISAGPDAVQIPVMTNFTREQALQALQALGFDAANITWDVKNSPDVLKDQVVETDPPAGQNVDPTGKITVYLSSGLVDMVDLTGKTEAEARAILQDLNLVADVQFEPVEDAAQVGKVIDQSRPEGPVEQGATVTVVVGQERQVETTTVPNGLEGKSYGEAQEALDAAGLNPRYVDEFSDTVDTGDVIRTQPGGGSTVNVGTSVDVFVSKGPDPDASGGGAGGGGGTP